MILMHGFVEGFLRYMVDQATSDFFGHARIRHHLFDETKLEWHALPEADKLQSMLESRGAELEAWTPRIYAAAMISSAVNSRNLQLVGVDPKTEAQFSRLKLHIEEGSFLDASGGILVGKKLSEVLQVGLGDKLVLTAAAIDSGELVQSLVRVKGIFSYQNRSLDEALVFVRLDEAQKLLQMPQQIHEYAIRFSDPTVLKADQQPAWIQQMKAPWRFESWHEFLPSLQATMALSMQSLGIMAFILAIMVGFTVTNTLYMSLQERRFEFGVMQALGTRPWQIRWMVLAESCGLVGLAIFLTTVLMLTVGSYLALYGVDYSGMSYANVSLRDPIYFRFSWQQALFYTVAMGSFVCFISLYPVQLILRLRTSEALRK